MTGNRWLDSSRSGGEEYDRQFAERERAGQDMHGEARLVESLGVGSVLDAGCGTGRVAIELAQRGIEIVGVDLDPRMLSAARSKAPDIDWRLADLTTLEVSGAGGGRRLFDAVLMAGNVMVFLEPGTEGRVVEVAAGHLRAGGLLVAGFQLAPDRLPLAAYDALCSQAGLSLAERWATWDRAPWVEGGDYAVSVHRAAGGPGSSIMNSMSDMSERMS